VRKEKQLLPGLTKWKNFGTKITQDAPVSVTDPVFRGQICLTDTKMTDRTEKRWKILSLRSIQTDLRTDDR